MKLIPLTRGKFAVVDDETFDELSKYKWFYTHYGYAGRSAKKHELEKGYPNVILMHRQLVNAAKKEDVDHIDGDRLNNQISNLRICNRRQNLQNQAKVMRTKKGKATSKYKGVYWAKDREKWRATIRANGKRVAIGSYDNEKEAALAYNEYASKYFGEFARLNEFR